jgi:hypothetical protein
MTNTSGQENEELGVEEPEREGWAPDLRRMYLEGYVERE